MQANDVLTIRPADLGGKIAAVVRVPGACTATMLVDQELWPMLPEMWQRFFIEHETGHVVRDTDDEFQANEYALIQFSKAGLPLTDALKALKWAVYNTGCQNPAEQLEAAIKFASKLSNDQDMEQKIYADFSQFSNGAEGPAGQGAMIETAPQREIARGFGITDYPILPAGAGGITQGDFQTAPIRDPYEGTGGLKPMHSTAPVLAAGSNTKDITDVSILIVQPEVKGGVIGAVNPQAEGGAILPQPVKGGAPVKTMAPAGGAGGSVKAAGTAAQVERAKGWAKRNWLLIAVVAVVVIYLVTRKK